MHGIKACFRWISTSFILHVFNFLDAELLSNICFRIQFPSRSLLAFWVLHLVRSGTWSQHKMNFMEISRTIVISNVTVVLNTPNNHCY